MGSSGLPDPSQQAPNIELPQGQAPDVSQSAQEQLGRLPQMGQQQTDPTDQLKAQLAQRIQQLTPPPPSGGPVKQYLQNWFHNMSNASSIKLGLPTPQQQQNQLMTQYQNLSTTQALNQLRQAQAAAQSTVPITLPSGDVIDMPAPSASKVLAAQARTQATMSTFTPESAAAIGHPEFAGQSVPKGIMDMLTRTTAAQISASGKGNTGLGKIDPIIAAQIGPPPDPSKFPQGQSDPGFQAQMKLWGVKAETVKNRMASAGAIARGQAFGLNRVGGYITPDGQLVTATGGQAIQQGMVPAAPGFNAMSKQAQFGEMNTASSKLRTAITALQPGDAFTPAAVAQMNLAMRAEDAGTLSTITNNLMASGLNERQQDYAVWLTQMAERVLSLRNIAGMGQGAEDMRRAIQATLPNVASGNKQLALKKLDAVDQQIGQLYKGIPKVSMNQGRASAGVVKWGRDAQGNPVRLP